MTVRVEQELALLRNRFPEMAFLADGLWCRLPGYVIPGEQWRQARADIAFRIPEALPGQVPYGFWVAGSIDPRRPGAVISNYTYPAVTGFGGEWGLFSWSPDGWNPGPTAAAGDNMVTWVGTFAHRLLEGP
jgi:hypothetical protein